MYSLFRVLFQSTLWKMLLRKATWQEAGRSLRRAHKDRRARKHLLQVFMAALIPIVCLLYLLWLVGSGAVLLVPFVLPAIWWRKRQAGRDDANLSIVPSTKFEPKDLSPADTARLRDFLAKMGLSCAIMVDRAGSESYLKRKVMPEGVEVTSRRVHLELLKRYAIWDLMMPLDRQAVMIADGHWDWKQVNHVASKMDLLRLLRWVLRLDFFLPVLGQQLNLDFEMAHAVVQEPEKFFKGDQLADRSDILTGLEAARTFHLRCIAEGINRGWFHAKTDNAVNWARELNERLAGKQHEDLVLGTKLVSEADDQMLTIALSVGELRSNFLNWVLALLDGRALPEWIPSLFEGSQEEDELEETTEATPTA